MLTAEFFITGLSKDMVLAQNWFKRPMGVMMRARDLSHAAQTPLGDQDIALF